MGILNVTPDSFSDGRLYFESDRAVARAFEMIEEGADIIDIGPESTRPGSHDVPADEQIRRAVPVIEAIRAQNGDVLLSIDTRLAAVASAALGAGVDMINDTSALRDDPSMVDLAAQTGAGVVLMHRKGKPITMQQDGGPHYDDVVGEICSFFSERMQFATSHGIDNSRMILDPGIGFGKRLEHNLLILRHLERFVALGQPLLVGASRKSMIASVCGGGSQPAAATRRLPGSLACAAIATLAGAAILRVHDVRETVETVRLCTAVSNANG
jgi:dihydropteroate synthase